MECSEVVSRLEALADPEAVAGMARFGITPEKTFGISIPALRGLAREIGRNHRLAGQLWDSGSREARILASMIDDPKMVTEEQMEAWAGEFRYWEICDQCCSNLFGRTGFALKKAIDWSAREEEAPKRAGFVLMTRLALADKKAPDELFEDFLAIIEREAGDGRNLVKKAVNWALRQIGKRNARLNGLAIQTAERIRRMDSTAARWVAADALRELKSEAVQRRLRGVGKPDHAGA